MSTTSGDADRHRRILRVVPTGCPPQDEVVAALIQRTADDLTGGRTDVTGSLRRIASAAWREGYDAGCARSAPTQTGPGPKPFQHRPRYPDASSDDYIVLITDPVTGTVDAQGPFSSATAKAVADQTRTDLHAAGLRDYTVITTGLLPFRLKTT